MWFVITTSYFSKLRQSAAFQAPERETEAPSGEGRGLRSNVGAHLSTSFALPHASVSLYPLGPASVGTGVGEEHLTPLAMSRGPWGPSLFLCLMKAQHLQKKKKSHNNPVPRYSLLVEKNVQIPLIPLQKPRECFKWGQISGWREWPP